MNVEDLCINTIRTLAMDAVQKATCGHPGTPMALAPLAYVLYHDVMRHNPRDPRWFNRDRFVLSAGHASMLQYATLHLAGYDVSLDDLKAFRQWASKTPGHPEAHLTPGIETTTGPLGQGISNAVGLAIAEAHLAAIYNRDGFPIVDHHTFAIVSDGDLMEGISHEAASIAGHLGLGKLVCVYDDNHITIEGNTTLAYSDDVQRRFEGYHWRVENLGEAANDLGALRAALERARREQDRPTLLILRSHIGYGAPTRQDTAEAHGEALGEKEVAGAKRSYGWPETETFLVPERAASHMRQVVARGAEQEKAWRELHDRYREAHPDLARQLAQAIAGELPTGWDKDLPTFDPAKGALATRVAGGKALVAAAKAVPWLIGGSADLAPSTKTLIESGNFAKGSYDGRNMHWGIRELGMSGCASGMALHGGVRPYVATFFVFTDYARPAIRLASIMGLPVIYVMTHDSIGLGEDGPTHQPVEHLAALRAMPGMSVIRPADANETTEAWRAALERRDGPTILVLTRQNVTTLDRSTYAPASGLRKGAYVLARERGATPEVILIGTGSEVELCVAAREKLGADGIDARIVSMPSWDLFTSQPQGYRDEVLPPTVRKRLAVEAASPFGWRQWVTDDGDVIGVSTFGASAPYKEIYKNYGLTVEAVVARARALARKDAR
ncbi:MAG: transketolase [Acidobacteriota bacterium]